MIFYHFVTDIFYNTVRHSLPFSIVFCHLFIMLYHVPSSKCSIIFLVSSCTYTWNMSFVAIVFQTYWTSQDQNVPNQRFSYSTCWQSITGVLCCFLFFKPLDQKTLDTKLNNLTPLNHVRHRREVMVSTGCGSHDWLHSHRNQHFFVDGFVFQWGVVLFFRCSNSTKEKGAVPFDWLRA